MAKNSKSKKNAKPSKPAKKIAKKPVAKKIKPTAKSAAKKSKAKPVIAKKVVKPIAKKAAKPATKTVKKPLKPIKKVVAAKKAFKKVVVKKALVKKVAKPAKPELKAKPAKVILKPDTKIVKKTVKELLPKAASPIVPAAPKPGKSRGRKKKKKGDDEDEFDGSEPLDPALLEILATTTARPSKKVKVPKIIKTFVNPINSLPTEFDTDSKGGKNKKEPKGKFELEYVVRTSPVILYECLSTPSGLSEWFADDVNIRDGVFTFFWDGSEQKAKLLGYKDEKFIRFRWIDKPEGTFFEFKIEKDELTGDISLIITDFAEEATDKTTSQLLWDSQVNKLLHVLGAV